MPKGGRHLLKQKAVLLSTFLLSWKLNTEAHWTVLLLLKGVRHPWGSQNPNHLGLHRPTWAFCIRFRNILRARGDQSWKQVINFIPAPRVTCVWLLPVCDRYTQGRNDRSIIIFSAINYTLGTFFQFLNVLFRTSRTPLFVLDFNETDFNISTLCDFGCWVMYNLYNIRKGYF